MQKLLQTLKPYTHARTDTHTHKPIKCEIYVSMIFQHFKQKIYMAKKKRAKNFDAFRFLSSSHFFNQLQFYAENQKKKPEKNIFFFFLLCAKHSLQ